MVYLLFFPINSSVVQSSAIWLRIARSAIRTLRSVRKKNTSVWCLRPCTHWGSLTLIWQKEASDKSDISRKRAKCVCHLHWRQWNIMMSYLTYLLVGWVFLHEIWPGRRVHCVNYENINNSYLDGMSLASFCQSRAELILCMHSTMVHVIVTVSLSLSVTVWFIPSAEASAWCETALAPKISPFLYVQPIIQINIWMMLVISTKFKDLVV